MPKGLCKGFDLAVLLVSWRLWKEHNSRVFNSAACSPAQVVRRMLEEEGDEWIVAGFTALLLLLAAAVVS